MIESPPVGFSQVFHPARVLVTGYIATILAGALVLMLPISSATGAVTPFLTAFFTATSAVCVTGLIAVDTATHFSYFGKTVILVLIQIGGLGYMTAYAFILLALGRKLSISEMSTLKTGLNLPHFGRLKQVVLVALAVAGVFELIGFVLLLPAFLARHGGGAGCFDAVFHSVSAFNNAGFSSLSNNLEGFSGNALVILVTASLVVFGGIGFFVLLDLYERFVLGKRVAVSLHTKTVLATTAWLLAAGFALFLLFEWFNPATLGNAPLLEKLLKGVAMAVYPRTTGFNTVNYAFVTPATLIFTVFLMTVGASPGGTGGGFKTSSLAIVVASLTNLFRGRAGTTLFARKIPARNLINAFSLIAVWVTTILAGTLLISLMDNFPISNIAFEVTSALGTVGLSRGITSSLSAGSQLVLIALMVAGRVGPITAGAVVFQASPVDLVHHPEEEVLVG